MMTKTCLILVSAAAFIVSGTPTAHAATADHAAELLTALVGHWDGHGVDHVLNNNGSMTDTPYSLDLELDSTTTVEGDAAWTANNNVETDQGVTRLTTTDFSVRNGLLFVSTNSGTEPVEVTESTPKSLTYQMKRVEVYTGRVFEFTFHVEMVDQDHIQGENTVGLNGVTIEDDKYSAKRW